MAPPILTLRAEFRNILFAAAVDRVGEGFELAAVVPHLRQTDSPVGQMPRRGDFRGRVGRTLSGEKCIVFGIGEVINLLCLPGMQAFEERFEPPSWVGDLRRKCGWVSCQ